MQALSVQGEESCLCLYDVESADSVEAALRGADLTPQGRPERAYLLLDSTA